MKNDGRVAGKLHSEKNDRLINGWIGQEERSGKADKTAKGEIRVAKKAI